MAGITKEQVQELLREQEKRHREEIAKLAQANVDSRKFNRNICIEQEKDKFKYEVCGGI